MKANNIFQGSVSLFLAMVLFPVYTCAYFVIDAARYEAAKEKAKGALNLCGNGALNDYDFAFKACYGLFALSAEGADREATLSFLFAQTADTDGAGQKNLISTKTDRFSVSYPDRSSLACPEVLERYVADYMKYRGPYLYARGLKQKLSLFRQSADSAEVLEKSAAYYDALSESDKTMGKICETLQSADTFSAETERKNIETLLSSTEDIKASLQQSSEKADAWKKSIEKMEEGEIKTLLSGEYQKVAGAFSSEGMEDFITVLQADLKRLQNYEEAYAENAETETPFLEYGKNPVYQYIAASASSSATEEEKQVAGEIKETLQALCGTDLGMLFPRAEEKSVSSLLEEALAASIETLGEKGSTPTFSYEGTPSLAQLSLVKKAFSGAETLLKKQAETGFMEEYLTEMFSCYITEAEGSNLAGYKLSENPLFGGEQEYILFGGDSLKENLLRFSALLFSFRFLFNCLYAFSNARMRGEALTVATALTGWTGIGITAAQNLILLLWAGGESVLDVASLCRGGTIPLYKNAATWTLSLRGAGQVLTDGASSLVSKEIDDIFAWIENTADGGIEQIAGAASNYFRQSTEGAAESLANRIVTPVETALTALIGNKTAMYAGWSEAELERFLTEAVFSVEGSSPALEQAKQIFKEQCVGALARELYPYYEVLFSTDEAGKEAAVSALKQALLNCYEKLFSLLNGELEKMVSVTEEKLHQVLSSAGEQTKNQAVNLINQYAETLGNYLGSGEGGSYASVFGSAGLAFSYQDYLKVLLFVAMQNKNWKNEILVRTGKVMQISTAQKEKHFDLTRAYTAIRILAEVRVSSYVIKEEKTYAY